MTASSQSPLHWFPFYRADWMNSSAVAAMLPEQEGAYWRLLVTSWGDGDVDPSLPADDTQLALLSKLGARWKKLGAPVRAMFVEREGRLYNTKLSAVWLEQSAKHAAASEKAKKAANARAEKKRLEDASKAASSNAPSTASSDRQAGLLSRENLDGSASPPTPNGVEEEKHEPAPDGALAPTGAAPRAPGAVGVASSIAAEQEARADHERRYFALLTVQSDAWMREHREDALAFGEEERALLGLPRLAELTPAMKRVVRDAVIERIRAQEHWPASDEWDGSDTLTPLEPASC